MTLALRVMPSPILSELKAMPTERVSTQEHCESVPIEVEKSKEQSNGDIKPLISVGLSKLNITCV